MRHFREQTARYHHFLHPAPFRAGIHNRVGCHCAGFDGLPALLINDGTRCNPAFMYPLLTAVQSGIHCLPLKALSASGTDNRV